MPTLAELKNSSPAYSSISDEEFAQRVYNKHYQGKISYDEFLQRTSAPEPVGQSGVTRAERQAQIAEMDAPIEAERERIGRMEDIGRGLSIGGRAMIRGVTAIPDIVAEPAAQLLNRVLPERYHQGGFTQAAENIMDAAGVVRPETKAERLSSDVTTGITGAATGVGLANALRAAGAGAAPTVAGRVGQVMAERPGAQIVGGSTGSLAAGATREAGGGPVAQLAAGLAGAVGPAAMAGRASTGVVPGRQQAISEAERLGVNLRGEPGDQATQLGRAGRLAQPESRGEAMSGVQQALRTERESARQVAGQRFEDVRAMDAGVLASEASEFLGGARRQLADEAFDLTEMPQLAKRIGRLGELLSTQGAREVKLKALEQWRKSVGRLSKKPGEEGEAARKLRNRYDDFIADQANRDLMTGDPNSAKAWREATDGWARFKGKFDADKTIASIIKGDYAGSPATVENMRNWVFGASANGAKPQAGAVVKRMNDILGPDSPQMDALRKEVVFDLIRPLLDETSDLKGFLARHENYFVNSPTLKRELFPGGVKELDSLVGLAKGISKRPGATLPPETHPSNRQFFGSVQRMLLASITGHQLGKASAQMSIGRQAMSRAEQALMLDRLRSATVGRAAKEDILRQWLGYEPGHRMFPAGTAIGQLGQAAQREPIEIDIAGGEVGGAPSEAELQRLRAGNVTGGF